MSDRCPICDVPRATDADDRACQDCDGCARCQALCWRPWSGDCPEDPIDWRARALAAEAKLRTVDDVICWGVDCVHQAACSQHCLEADEQLAAADALAGAVRQARAACKCLCGLEDCAVCSREAGTLGAALAAYDAARGAR